MKNFLFLLLVSSLLILGCAKKEEAVAPSTTPDSPSTVSIPVAAEPESITLLTAENGASVGDMVGNYTGTMHMPDEFIEMMKQMMIGMAEAFGGDEDGKSKAEIEADIEKEFSAEAMADMRIMMDLRKDGTCTLSTNQEEDTPKESTWTLSEDGTTVAVAAPETSGEEMSMVQAMDLGISEDKNTLQFSEAQMGMEMTITFTRD